MIIKKSYKSELGTYFIHGAWYPSCIKQVEDAHSLIDECAKQRKMFHSRHLRDRLGDCFHIVAINKSTKSFSMNL